MTAPNRAVVRSLIAQLFRFGLTGLAATSIHFATLTVAVEYGGIPPAISNGLAFCLALTATYLGQSYYVFRDTKHSPARMRRYLITAIGGLVGNVGIMTLSVDVVGVSYQFGFVAGLLTVPAATFLASRLWVFRRTEECG